ncbi:effector binding domain-containing protein [Enterococcus sp. LJL99]
MKLFSLTSTTTNNFDDPEMSKKIQHVWSEAMKQVKQPKVMYGVYHNFASDFRGDYQLSIATESIQTNQMLTIDSKAKYEKFEVDGTQEIGIYKTWQKIWTLEEEGKLKRAYRFDYECYQVDGEVALYIEII